MTGENDDNNDTIYLSILVKYLIEYLTGENDDDNDGEDDEEEGVYERFLNYLSQQKPPRYNYILLRLQP